MNDWSKACNRWRKSHTSHWLLAVMLIFVTGAGEVSANAGQAPEAPKKEWSISPILGVHQPSLKGINEGVFQAPFAATSELAASTGANDSLLFTFPNPLPELGPSGYAGFEFEWAMTPRTNWIAGFGTWEGNSSAIASGPMPFQRGYTDTIFQRKASVSYNEVYFGTRYNILFKPKQYRIYGRFTLNTLFDIDYRENQLFQFKIEDGLIVTRSIIVEGRTTAALTTQTGIGAEYYIGDRFSLSLEADITLSTRKFYLSTSAYNTDFADNDGYLLFFGTVDPDPYGRLEYLTISEDNTTEYNPMKLEVNGWKLLFRVSMFY